MAKSNVDWFGVREKYCSLAKKVRLISQTSPKCCVLRTNFLSNHSWEWFHPTLLPNWSITPICTVHDYYPEQLSKSPANGWKQTPISHAKEQGVVRQLLKLTTINKRKNEWTKNSFLARQRSSKEKEKLSHSQIFTIHRERSAWQETKCEKN